MDGRVPTRLTAREGRKFGLTVGAAFVALGLLLGWRGAAAAATASAVAGGVLVAAGVLVPTRLGPVQRAWMRFGLLLSKVTTPIVMAILYFVMFMPMGLVMRLAGRNPLRRRLVNDSYWVAREPGRTRGDLARQF